MRARSTQTGFLFAWLIAATTGLAGLETTIEEVHAESSPCGSLQSTTDIIQCALSFHPELQRSQFSFDQSAELEGIARQLPNPQFQGSSQTGKFLGDRIIDTTASLMFPIQVAGQRSSRIDKAIAEREMGSANLLKTREDVFVETASRLIRLRQLGVEMHLLEEALTTFRKVQGQYRVRPRLTPEQQTSLSVFQVAQGDYELRRASLQAELEAVKRTLAVSLGLVTFDPQEALLPKKRSAWPAISSSGVSSEFRGSAMKLAQTQLGIAQADMAIAQADSWPAFAIGPSLENENEGGLNRFSYGISLSFTLPILNQNGGGRAFARKGLLLAETSLALRNRELSTERDILLQRYKTATEALHRAPDSVEVERKHRALESHFERGVVPSSLVIEAHRQMVDLAKSQHEMELTATEALFRIRALEGRLFEEVL